MASSGSGVKRQCRQLERVALGLATVAVGSGGGVGSGGTSRAGLSGSRS